MSLTAVRPLHWPTLSPPSLPYGPPVPATGWGSRALPGRYGETVASPSSQNRQGYAEGSPPAPPTPTRGPLRTLTSAARDVAPSPRRGTSSWAAARSTRGLSVAVGRLGEHTS